MAHYPRTTEKRRSSDEFSLQEEEMLEDLSRSVSPKTHLEHEKKLRREIANSNERRRMQSINAGFQSLKTLIPHHEGEKLSKAAILQQTSEYITNLETEKTRLLTQNTQLKRLMSELSHAHDGLAVMEQNSPPPKRKKRDTESSDEGISLGTSPEFEEPSHEELKREMIELRCQLDRERRLRMMLEEQTRSLESQLYPERLRQIATQVQAQMRYQEEKKRYLDEQRRKENTEIKREDEEINAPILPSSMSRRNLETIVEAIRHLEGDHVLQDRCASRMQAHRDIIHSEESDDKDSIATLSDQEEGKGRDSPLNSYGSTEASSVSSATTTLHVQHQSHIVSTEKYPIAMQLLHRPAMPSAIPAQYFQRPGVIVQKSS